MPVSPPRLRRKLAVALIWIVGIYVAITAAAYLFQRSLMYPAPAPRRPAGNLLTFDAGSGRKGYAVHLPAPVGAPTVVYFHGNGEQLADAVHLAGSLQRLGLGVFAVEYPGYGLAAAQPISEGAIMQTAQAAVTYLTRKLRLKRSQIVLFGQSLGTGVAVELAHRGLGARLVLISPYTSMPDMAQHRFPFLPARWLVKDRFDSLQKASLITIPTLIIHGRRDGLIPVTMARRLAKRFPKASYLELPDAGHNDMFSVAGATILQRIQQFILRGR